MGDIYKSFSELQQGEQEGIDYTVDCKKGIYPVTIVAPHGGLIEPGTSNIAWGIVDGVFNGYRFNGNTPRGEQWRLHVKATNFDDERMLELIDASDFCLAVHGWVENSNAVYVGGRNEEIRHRMLIRLQQQGYDARDAIGSRYDIRGISPKNFINRVEGLQLELCKGLSQKLQDENELEKFSGIVRRVLLDLL